MVTARSMVSRAVQKEGNIVLATRLIFCTNKDMEAKLHQFEVFKVEPKYGFAD